MLAGLHIQHELPERPVQPRNPPAQEGKPCTREPRAGFEIHAQRGRDVGVFFRREIELAQAPPARDFDIFLLIRAIRHIGAGQVGDNLQRRLQLCRQFIRAGLQRGHLFLERRNLGLDHLGRVLVTLGHRHADQLGGFVATRLRDLHGGRRGAAVFVERNQLGRQRLQPAPGQPCIKSLGVLSDKANIVHGPGLCPLRWPKKSRNRMELPCLPQGLDQQEEHRHDP